MANLKIPTELPNPLTLKSWMKGLALCDSILSPEWEYRYFSYDHAWGTGQEMASIRSGSGDSVYIVFQEGSVFVKGFSHEYPTNIPYRDYYKDVPPKLREHTTEVAFEPELVNFCFWRDSSQSHWAYSVSPEQTPENAFFLFDVIDGNPRSYADFCAEYYEVDVSSDDIGCIFERQPLTEGLVKRLNADADYSDILAEMKSTNS